MKKQFLIYSMPILILGGMLTSCNHRATPEETMGEAYKAVENTNQEDFDRTLSPSSGSISTRALRGNSFASLKTYLADFEDLRISGTKMTHSEKGLLGQGICGDAANYYEVSVIGNQYQIHHKEAEKGQKQGMEERVYAKDVPVLTATLVCHRWIDDESYSYALIPCTKFTQQSQGKKAYPEGAPAPQGEPQAGSQGGSQAGSQGGSQAGTQTGPYVERDATDQDSIQSRCDIVSWSY